MRGKTKFVQNILESTLNITGGTKNTIVSGVGINKEPHLGLQLKLIGAISKGEAYINCNFQILKSGNAHKDLEKYAQSGEVVNVEQLSVYKDMYFKTSYFVIQTFLCACPLRFKIDDRARITEHNNKGEEVIIFKISKYPDDPENHNFDSTFGAFYLYAFKGNTHETKKDEFLDKIMAGGV